MKEQLAVQVMQLFIATQVIGLEITVLSLYTLRLVISVFKTLNI